MKKILLLTCFLFSFAALGSNSLKCTSYHLPKDCSFDDYDIRGWDCKESSHPTNSNGVPYESITELNVTLINKQLLIEESQLDKNKHLVEKKTLYKFENIICIDGVSNCESADRKIGVYIYNNDYETYSMKMRLPGKGTNIVAEYEECKYEVKL